MSHLRLLIGTCLLALAVAACGGTGQEKSASTKDVSATIAVVTHGAPDDAFWSVVKAGADRAGKDLGVKVQYNSDPDVTKQAELVDAAVAKKVDGIVVSMADPDGMKDAVEKAVSAGIPVITINSGLAESKEFGAITHVGQDETLAGQLAGEKFNELGVKKLVCVIHEASNIGLQQRCAGAKSKFQGDFTTLQVQGADTGKSADAIQSALQADKTIDGVLTLNAQVTLGAVQANQEVGGKAQVASFDMGSDILQGIKDGDIVFTVDQQPFLQGYLGVSFLYLKKLNGNDVGGGQPVYSGPALVTKDNVDRVIAFAKGGTR
jgi:simple sugar transport system substrate-binding protein